MTTEEAIKMLEYIKRTGNGESEYKNDAQAIAIDMAIKALKQGDVLDKIKAEIEQEYNCLRATRADETLELGECLGLKMALKIIDKYKAESEGK